MLQKASSDDTGQPSSTAPDRTDPPGETPTVSGPRARIVPILLDAAQLWWHRIGLIMGVSLTGAGLLAVPFWTARHLPSSLSAPVHYAIVVALLIVAGAIGLAGGYSVFWRVCSRVQADYTDFWQGARSLFRPALALAGMDTLVGTMLGVSLWYYGHIPAAWGRAASVVCGYFLLFWLMMAVYHFPVLVAQETGAFDDPGRTSKRGALPVLRRAFYLALGSPFFTFGLVAVCLVLAGLMALTLALPALLWLGTVSLLTTAATRALLLQFSVLPAPAEEIVVPDEKFRLPEQRENRVRNRQD